MAGEREGGQGGQIEEGFGGSQGWDLGVTGRKLGVVDWEGFGWGWPWQDHRQHISDVGPELQSSRLTGSIYNSSSSVGDFDVNMDVYKGRIVPVSELQAFRNATR